jgi:hypothetical protein
MISRINLIKNKSFVIIVIVLVFMSLLIISYLCPSHVCSLNSWSSPDSHFSQRSLNHVIKDNLGMSLSSHPLNHMKLSFDDMLSDDAFVFDIKGNDVIVFLHIQKTGQYFMTSHQLNNNYINECVLGGTTFGRHLVRDLDLEKPCLCKRGRKKCKCVRPDSKAKLWLFSRYSTGWKCGLHADFTVIYIYFHMNYIYKYGFLLNLFLRN